KSASSEPLFAPAFVAGLVRRLPALGGGVAAATWPGGRTDLEGPLLARVGRVVAYGDRSTVDDLRRRAGDKLVAHGPKISVAWVPRRSLVDGRLERLARGLARDIALFDQRGCLSIQAVLTDGDPGLLLPALARALRERAAVWPAGPDPAAAAAARQARDVAVMGGCDVADLPLDAGTVIAKTGVPIEPSPGYRTVTIHAVGDVDGALDQLAPWRGRLQGVAAADPAGLDDGLRRRLQSLGVSHVAAPGDLQTVDVATWRNGGFAPLDAFL
ncbi:MAG: acyl-CoA reductase, partial [Acidobacteriota bacterium]